MPLGLFSQVIGAFRPTARARYLEICCLRARRVCVVGVAMVADAWRTWRGHQVADFVEECLDLPQYRLTIERNLPIGILVQLQDEGLLSKGLARAGICSLLHQRAIDAGLFSLRKGELEKLRRRAQARREGAVIDVEGESRERAREALEQVLLFGEDEEDVDLAKDRACAALERVLLGGDEAEESARDLARDALESVLLDDDEDGNTGDSEEGARGRARDALEAVLLDDDDENTGDNEEGARDRARDALEAALFANDDDTNGGNEEGARDRARDALKAVLLDESDGDDSGRVRDAVAASASPTKSPSSPALLSDVSTKKQDRAAKRPDRDPGGQSSPSPYLLPLARLGRDSPAATLARSLRPSPSASGWQSPSSGSAHPRKKLMKRALNIAGTLNELAADRALKGGPGLADMELERRRVPTSGYMRRTASAGALITYGSIERLTPMPWGGRLGR